MRSSGVLLHISSLSGPYGVGDLGIEAHRFAQFLSKSKQTWWQMFPLGPPGMSNSPYQVLSAFAGNPLFISLDALVKEKLLKPSDIRVRRKFNPDHANFEMAWKFKKPLFHHAFANFVAHPHRLKKEFDAFCLKEKDWLDDYALYCAIKGKYRGASWEKWPEPLRRRNPAALQSIFQTLKVSVQYHQFLQFLFHRQWMSLRKECQLRGVKLMGDIPIFVAHDSADVWAHPELFSLDKRGRPTHVAGVPPDYFSQTGQRWGNPLYRWDALKRRGYDWWIRRFKSIFNFFDAARVDHFIGFHNYWKIPAAHKTAINGKWVKGPGEDFFKVLQAKFGKLPLIAEDLGVVTPDVISLRDKFGFPGMRILQFAFSGDPAHPFLPENYVKNTVVYTGTHDNDTTVGWYKNLSPEDKKHVEAYLGKVPEEIEWDLIRLAFSSVANIAIVPMQDLLGLGNEARMNMPGTPSGNWTWRMKPRAVSPKLIQQLKSLTELYGRR